MRLRCTGSNVLTAALVTELTAAGLKLLANLVDFLDGFLLNISFVLSLACLAVAAATKEIVVAHLVSIRRHLLSARATGWFSAITGRLCLLGLNTLSTLIKTSVIRSMGETATISKLAFAVLLEVKAVPSWRSRNLLPFAMLVLAIITIPAAALISECAAYFGHLRYGVGHTPFRRVSKKKNKIKVNKLRRKMTAALM